MTDPISQLQGAWSELQVCLRTRFRALSDEMRAYPTPIARCDEQLTRLIEQRDAVRAELERAARIDAGGGVAASTIDALEPFVEEGAADNDALAATRSRFAAALASTTRPECEADAPRFMPSFPISEWK